MTSNLWALPTEEELDGIDLAVGFAALVRDTANKRSAILKLAAVSIAILAAEKAEVAQLAAIIQHGLDLYRQHEAEGPTVILGPGVQAKLDSDPALKAAFAGVSEKMATAMQGVKEGRYKSFDEAMDALGAKAEPLNDEDREAIERFEAEMLPGNKTKQ